MVRPQWLPNTKREAMIAIAASSFGAIATYICGFGTLMALLKASEGRGDGVWVLFIPIFTWAGTWGACKFFEGLGPPFVNYPTAIVVGAYLGPTLYLAAIGALNGGLTVHTVGMLVISAPFLAIVPMFCIWPAPFYLSRANIDFSDSQNPQPQIFKPLADMTSLNLNREDEP